MKIIRKIFYSNDEFLMKKEDHIFDGTNDVVRVRIEANWTIETTFSIVVRKSKEIIDVNVKWRSV